MVHIDARRAVLLVFLSVSLYNFLELNAIILGTFKRRNGLYFWSFIIATWGVAFNSIGFLLKHLKLTTWANLYATLILIGWCSMITGQSVVLYSRLHLVMHSRKRLRAVLIMIITNAIWLHIPIIIMIYGANSNNPTPFEKPYPIYEKLQLSVFFVQELIISGLYVWETTGLLKLEKAIGNSGTLRVMRHLIYVNILVIMLDFTILGLEFANLYDFQTAWKPFAYSVKLKLEFSILDRLVEHTIQRRSGNTHSYNRTVPRSEGLPLDKLGGTDQKRSVVQGSTQLTQYEVHVGKGKEEVDKFPLPDSTIIKTSEFQIQNHSRRRNSKISLTESGREILAESATYEEPRVGRGSASSVSSEI
jgi:hypothetical protein